MKMSASILSHLNVSIGNNDSAAIQFGERKWKGCMRYTYLSESKVYRIKQVRAVGGYRIE